MIRRINLATVKNRLLDRLGQTARTMALGGSNSIHKREEQEFWLVVRKGSQLGFPSTK